MTQPEHYSPTLKFFKNAIWKYLLELITVIFGVYIGFMANKYQENQKEYRYTQTVIKEMYQSLANDINDATENWNGHKKGLASVAYFFKIAEDKPVSTDTFTQYLVELTRSFLSIQNTAPFEALKATGLNVITNDSLRSKIVHLYDFQYDIMEKVEEQYPESNFAERYYQDIVGILDKGLVLDKEGRVVAIRRPLPISQEEKVRLFLHLKKIYSARWFNITVYKTVIEEMKALRSALKKEYPYLE
ncbi:MAG: hypothetical protein HUU01_17295 [Saprospiraceae bacterium]|nr:hypothetical protein [Saprospiraceae bacterium]